MKTLLDGMNAASTEAKPRGPHRHAPDRDGFRTALLKAGGKAQHGADVSDKADASHHRPKMDTAQRAVMADLPLRLAPHGLRHPGPDAEIRDAKAGETISGEDASLEDEQQPAAMSAAASMLASLSIPAPVTSPKAAPVGEKPDRDEDQPTAKQHGKTASAPLPPEAGTSPSEPPAEKPVSRIAASPAARPDPTMTSGHDAPELPVSAAESRSLPAPVSAQPPAAIASFATGMADALAAQPAAAATTASPKAGHSQAAAGPMQSLTIHLHPAELGAVTAQLRMVGDALEVHILVQTAKAYRELSDDTDGITRALQAIGLRVESVTVQAPAPSAAPDRADSGQGQSQGQGNNAFAQPDGARGEGRGFRGGNDNRSGGFADEMAPYGRERVPGEGAAAGGGLYI